MASNREQISIPLDASLRHALELIAESEDRPIAYVARRALAAEVERRQAEEKAA